MIRKKAKAPMQQKQKTMEQIASKKETRWLTEQDIIKCNYCLNQSLKCNDGMCCICYAHSLSVIYGLKMDTPEKH